MTDLLLSVRSSPRITSSRNTRMFDESLQKQRENQNLAAIVAKGTKEFIVNYDTNGDSKTRPGRTGSLRLLLPGSGCPPYQDFRPRWRW